MPRIAKKLSSSSKNAAALSKKRQTTAKFVSNHMSLSMIVPGSFDWNIQLLDDSLQAVPVSSFQFAPMNESWGNFRPGLKVEVVNSLVSEDAKRAQPHWIATVLDVAGYKVKLRYEGFTDDEMIHDRHLSWKEFLLDRLTTESTLPPEFQQEASIRVWDCPLTIGMIVEVVDKLCISANCPAEVVSVIGRRLKLKYLDMQNDMKGTGGTILEDDAEAEYFHCHHCSPLLHYVGWSQEVGHSIKASSQPRCFSAGIILVEREGDRVHLGREYRETLKRYYQYEAPPDCADQISKIKVGMKVEAVDPLNLTVIGPATITKILKGGYLMVSMDASKLKDGKDWFCYHFTSASIMPVGFCEKHGIPISAKHMRGRFSWPDYLQSTSSEAVPEEVFPNRNAKLPPGFVVGAKLEAADLMDPKLICVSTVVKIAGRLLKIHFDSWDPSFDQWLPCDSPDIYPVGWTELVGYPLEGPKIADALVAASSGHKPLRKVHSRGGNKISRRGASMEASKNGEKEVQAPTSSKRQRSATPSAPTSSVSPPATEEQTSTDLDKTIECKADAIQAPSPEESPDNQTDETNTANPNTVVNSTDRGELPSVAPKEDMQLMQQSPDHLADSPAESESPLVEEQNVINEDISMKELDEAVEGKAGDTVHPIIAEKTTETEAVDNAEPEHHGPNDDIRKVEHDEENNTEAAVAALDSDISKGEKDGGGGASAKLNAITEGKLKVD